MVQTTNPKGAAKAEVASIIPWLQVRVLPVLFGHTTVPVIYSAVKPFDPTCGAAWRDFVRWSGLSHLRKVVSLDTALCPSVIEELIDDDWDHNVKDDHRTHLFHDVDYLVRRIAGTEQVNVLALLENPADGAELRAFNDARFEFNGFDLMDRQLGNSALLNCGGFPEAFSAADLSDCGLLIDHAKALHVQTLLRQEYPDEYHADCDVWAIWRMKNEESGRDRTY